MDATLRRMLIRRLDNIRRILQLGTRLEAAQWMVEYDDIYAQKFIDAAREYTTEQENSSADLPGQLEH